MKIAAVSYWYPMPDEDKWARLMAIKPALAIINPASGPGETADPRYQQLGVELLARGIKVLGYISTRWANPFDKDEDDDGKRGKQIWEVTGDRRLYHRFYPEVTGFFYDESATEPERIDYYTFLVRPNAGGIEGMVLNPGTYPDPVYLKLPAIKMVVETSYGNYVATNPPAWVLKETNKSHFWHCVYDVKTVMQMRHVVDLAKRRNAGYLWCCEDNEYNKPPPYLEEMAALVKGL